MLRVVLAFQALDAIERAQDLAEEVGNKVRPDSVSGAGVKSPGGIVGGWRGPPSPLIPRALPGLQELPQPSPDPGCFSFTQRALQRAGREFCSSEGSRIPQNFLDGHQNS